MMQKSLLILLSASLADENFIIDSKWREACKAYKHQLAATRNCNLDECEMEGRGCLAVGDTNDLIEMTEAAKLVAENFSNQPTALNLVKSVEQNLNYEVAQDPTLRSTSWDSAPVTANELIAIEGKIKLLPLIVESLTLKLLDKDYRHTVIECGHSSSCNTFASFDKIWGYGCHCFFGPDWNMGRSEPVNEVDRSCQTLNQCYQCVKIDGKHEEDYSCEPYTTNYTVPYAKTILDHGVELACEEANPDNECAQRTCCCDTNFVSELLEQYFDGITFDRSYKHSLGWNFQENCPSKGGPGCDNCYWECCGRYPFRFPYRNKPGDAKGCCGSTVYDQNKYDCCPDETIRNVCPIE